MAGICGWIGVPGVAARSDAVMRLMQARLHANDRDERASETTLAWGLGVAARPVPAAGNAGGLFVGDEVSAVLCGDPLWRSSELCALARAEGNAAALAAAYQRRGPDLLDQLEGPFAFAVVDAAGENGMLAIDRFGVHGLCYAADPDGGLSFGTTTDSVSEARVTDDLSLQGIYEYFRFDRVPAPSAIRRGQAKLRAGEFLAYRRGRLDRKFYWDLARAAKRSDVADNLEEVLFSALRSAVGTAVAGRGAAESGAFLSGGLDSSTITGLLGAVTGAPARSFTIGFDDEGFDESAYANITVDHFQTSHAEYRLTAEDAFDFLPRMAAAFDEPFCNLSCIPVYYCAKMAAAHGVDLLLAGDGGDELFGGNPQYLEQSIFEGYLRVPTVIRKGLIEPGLALVPLKGQIAFLRKVERFVERANVPLPERLFFRSFYRSSLFHDTLDPSFRDAVDTAGPDSLISAAYDRFTGGTFLQRILCMDLQLILADGDLRKVTRMSQLAGIDVAYPFLDEAVAAAAARVPPDDIVRYRTLRYFYKRAMRSFLPRAVIDKKKKGFGPPYELWLSDYAPLRDMVMDSVKSCGGRQYLNRRTIDALLSRDDRRPRWHDDLCWKLAVLDLWHRAFDERRRSAELLRRSAGFPRRGVS